MLVIDIMAIIETLRYFDPHETTLCVICRVRLYPDRATAGLHDADGLQAFACVSHFSEIELLIIGWVDFTTNERQRYKERADQSAWLNT